MRTCHPLESINDCELVFATEAAEQVTGGRVSLYSHGGPQICSDFPEIPIIHCCLFIRVHCSSCVRWRALKFLPTCTYILHLGCTSTRVACVCMYVCMWRACVHANTSFQRKEMNKPSISRTSMITLITCMWSLDITHPPTTEHKHIIIGNNFTMLCGQVCHAAPWPSCATH